MLEITPSTYLKSANKGCVFCNPCPSLFFSTSENFHVLYDPFAILPGHLLIVSKEHIGCLGLLPLTQFLEYQKVLNQVKSQLENHFGSVILYEHGCVGHCFSYGLNDRSCLHFHQHLVPAEIDIHPLLETKYRGYRVNDEKEIPKLMDKYGNYLLFENAEGEMKFYPADSTLPPHYIRTLISSELGFPSKKDWKNYTSCECFLKGKAILENTPHQVEPKKKLALEST